jgi:hypothetical protein
MINIAFQDASVELPRLDGQGVWPPIRRADGVSSPNLACLLAGKQPAALLAKVGLGVTGFCYFFER